MERIGKLLQQRWVRPFATLTFVVILAAIFTPEDLKGAPIFWKPQNLVNLLQQISATGILAIGMTLVIISGGIDLSVGSLLALSGTLFARFFKEFEGPLSSHTSAASAIVIALAAASLLGAVSGLLVARLRLQPFIATLAIMIGARGLTLWHTSNNTFALGFDRHTAAVTQVLRAPGTMVCAFLAVALLGYVLLEHTRFGRYIKAIGGSEDAAHLSGISISWVKVRVYLFSGFAAGVAGVIFSAFASQGDPKEGVAFELDAIAAAVIGGTSLAGGRGSIFGTLVGVLTLGILSNLLTLNNVGSNEQLMLKAVIIVAAVWLQSIGKKRTP